MVKFSVVLKFSLSADKKYLLAQSKLPPKYTFASAVKSQKEKG